MRIIVPSEYIIGPPSHGKPSFRNVWIFSKGPVYSRSHFLGLEARRLRSQTHFPMMQLGFPVAMVEELWQETLGQT